MAVSDLPTTVINYTSDGFKEALDKSTKAISHDPNGDRYYIEPSHGGIGDFVPTKNSVIIGNDELSLSEVPSKAGAFYSSQDGAVPQFGTLPVKFGGTGVKTVQGLKIALGLANDKSQENAPLEVKYGGTGKNSFTKNAILVGNDSNSFNVIPVGKKDQILMGNAEGQPPTFQDQKQINTVGTIISGTWNGNWIQPEFGGTGCNSLDATSNALNLGLTINAPIPVKRGGTGQVSLGDLLGQLKSLPNEYAITNTNIIPNIISPNKTITTDTTLNTNHLGYLLIVNSSSDITLKLPDDQTSYEVEIFRFGTGNVKINSKKSLYSTEGTATTVKISDQYSSIGIKRFSDGWIITGGVEKV